jgi:hypothetical protein
VNSVYTINGKPISKTISQKDLGVLTTPTLKRDLHTLHICSKAQKMLGFLHRTSDPCFSIEARRCLYLSLVHSNLGYASEVWSALSGKNLRMVEGIQRCETIYSRIPQPLSSLQRQTTSIETIARLLLA